MSAINSGIRAGSGLDALLRRGTRLAAVAIYVTAVIVALALIRPAFRDTPATTLLPSTPAGPPTDKIRKGESIATFAARHGLGLDDLLALNPEIDSLSLKRGAELRIG